MDLRDIIQKVYDELEHDRVENALMLCVRLARGIQDHLYSAIFLRETDGMAPLLRALHNDWKELKQEAIDFIQRRSLEYWLQTRTMDFSFGRDEKGDEMNVLAVAVGELDSDLAQLERVASELSVPAGMTPYDVAAFTDSYDRQRARIRLQMKALRTVKHRIKTRCLNYAISIERQLDAQQRTESFLHQVQNEVNNYFRGRSEDVFIKLQKAAHLIDSRDSEDRSLLLTQVRRAIKAAADFFYPAAGKVVCSDGNERNLSDDRYLDRLQEYVAVTFAKSSSSGLLRAEMEYLIAFARRLNELASKGVHAEVSADEARQGLLGLYMFLYNVIAKLQRTNSERHETHPHPDTGPM